MARLRRQETYQQPAGAGGGGGPVVAFVDFGPDYGEGSGNDGITAAATAHLSVPTIGVTRTQQATALLTVPTIGVLRTQPASAHLSASVIGAPFWQSVATATTVSGFDIVVPKPSGVVEGDLVVAHIAEYLLTTATSIPNVPSGWTFIRSIISPGTLKVASYTYWKIAGGSEPADYTWSLDGDIKTGEIHRFNGTHATTPINASAQASLNATALDSDPDSPSVTTTVANCLVISFLAHNHAALNQTHSPGASHVERSDFEAGSTLFGGSNMQERVFVAIGATGTVAHDCTETVATDAVMIRIAIAPGSVILAP